MTESLSPSASRRTFLKGIGGAAAAGVGLGSMTGPAAAFDWDDAKTVGAYALGGPVGLAWAIHEYQPFAEDSPPEGLTASALEQDFYETAMTRKSTNASTIVDNQNILSGAENIAYTKGKTAAIEELNAGSTQQAVQDAATAAVNAHATTVKKNLLKTWNESVLEWDSMATTVANHSNLAIGDVLDESKYNTGTNSFQSWTKTGKTQRDITLPDGSTMTVERAHLKYTHTQDYEYNNKWDPKGGTGDDRVIHVSTSSGSLQHIPMDRFSPIFSEITTKFDSARNGVVTWVDSVYDSVQSGEIEVADLMTPSERAAMLAEDGAEAKAIADLAALNIPVDVEREATVKIAETGATLRGMLGLTDSSDGPIEAATTYDASTFTGDVYLTFDVSQAQGSWSAYETAVDGGIVTLTEEPEDSVQYRVHTTANETATVNSSEWSATDNSTWTHDLSDQLETDITEVESIDYLSKSDTTNYQTTEITGTFTVEKLVNTETGEEAESAEFTSSEPQDDSNYITQSEWDSLVEQNKELIDKWEAAQEEADSGGTSGGGDSGGLGAQLKDWAQNRPAEAAGSVLAISGLGYLYSKEGE